MPHQGSGSTEHIISLSPQLWSSLGSVHSGWCRAFPTGKGHFLSSGFCSDHLVLKKPAGVHATLTLEKQELTLQHRQFFTQKSGD